MDYFGAMAGLCEGIRGYTWRRTRPKGKASRMNSVGRARRAVNSQDEYRGKWP